MESLKKGASLADESHDELVKNGAEIYAKNCATCHMPDGAGIPGAFPALSGSAVVNGDIKAQANLILNGRNAMPAFGKQLKAAELAEVITFTRNALGNSKGDEIQPKEINALLGGDAVADAESDKDSAKPEAVEQPKAEEKVEKSVEKPKKADKPAVSSAKAEMTLTELVKNGESVYEKNCQSCHQKDGVGMPPMFPALKGSAVVTGKIDAQVEIMLKGKGMMPAFGKTLSAVDFASVLAFTRNSLGNSAGDFKQPSAIEALQSSGK